MPQQAKDLRDFFNTGGTFRELLDLAQQAPNLVGSFRTDAVAGESKGEPNTQNPNWLALGSDEGRTDLANAKRFVEKHRRRVRFCHPWKKWLVFDGRRWEVDQRGRAMHLAKRVAIDVFAKVVNSPFADDKSRQFAMSTAGVQRLNAMLALAASELGIPILPDDMDADPWLLNCLNGTVDLRTGRLRKHNPADTITKLCGTRYNPEAKCPVWEDTLLRSLQTIELVRFIQRVYGYCATGDVREQLLLIFWGCGSNGKTTLLNAFLDMLGKDYSLQAASGLLLAKRNESHPTELADLFGKRFVVCAETEDSRRLAEATVKQLTGADRIRARRMRENFWEFQPTHKVLLCTNHKPEVRGTDHAIWRRLALVPFNVRFWNADRGETGPAGLRQDKTLPEKLRAEREGILTWAVRGCLDWQQNGLQIPDAVRAATDEYRGEQDTIASFLDECCVIGAQCTVQAKDLYETYKTWAERSGEYALPQRRFGRQMTERQFERFTANGTRYRGVGLRSDQNQPTTENKTIENDGVF